MGLSLFFFFCHFLLVQKVTKKDTRPGKAIHIVCAALDKSGTKFKAGARRLGGSLGSGP